MPADSTADDRHYNVVVLELEDVVPQRDPKRPNLLVARTLKSVEDFATDVRQPVQASQVGARVRVVRIRPELSSQEPLLQDDAKRSRRPLVQNSNARDTPSIRTAGLADLRHQLERPRADRGRSRARLRRRDLTPGPKSAYNNTSPEHATTKAPLQPRRSQTRHNTQPAAHDRQGVHDPETSQKAERRLAARLERGWVSRRRRSLVPSPLPTGARKALSAQAHNSDTLQASRYEQETAAQAKHQRTELTWLRKSRRNPNPKRIVGWLAWSGSSQL